MKEICHDSQKPEELFQTTPPVRISLFMNRLPQAVAVNGSGFSVVGLLEVLFYFLGHRQISPTPKPVNKWR